MVTSSQTYHEIEPDYLVGFKKRRRIGLILCGVLAVFFGYLGIRGVGLSSRSSSSWLFPANLEKPSGVITQLEGSLYVQRGSELAFFSGRSGDRVMLGDFVMVGPESSGKIKLQSGTEIQLNPGTMVQFPVPKDQPGKLKIIRTPEEVVPTVLLGSVKTQKANKVMTLVPQIKKSDTLALGRVKKDVVKLVQSLETQRLLAPKPKEIDFSQLPKDEAKELIEETSVAAPVEQETLPKFQILLSKDSYERAPFQYTPIEVPLKIEAGQSEGVKNPTRIRLDVQRENQVQVISTKKISFEPKSKAVETTISLEGPGSYSVSLNSEDSPAEGASSLDRKRLEVKREFLAFEIGAPKIGQSEQLDSRQLDFSLKSFELRLPIVKGWEEAQKNGVLSASKILFRNLNEGSEFSLPLKREVKTDRFEFFANQSISAQILGVDSHGFEARSREIKIEFKFSPPKLALPRDGDSVSLQEIQAKDAKGLLFTFGRSALSEKYELEVSLSIDFSRVVSRASTTNNFVNVKDLNPGVYFWRVRSVRKSTKSQFSRPFKLVVTR